MLRETVLASLVAGLIAALVFTLVQSVWVTPLILQGETYEEAAEALPQHHEAETGHHHDEDEWKPQDGWQRTSLTFAANLLLGVGYSFVLIALYLLWREPGNALGGALYGLAGFAVFFVAPAIGLPPDLPGTAAAELGVRQQWWAMTVLATAAGLILLFSRTPWRVRILAVALIVAPHLVPAPHPAVESSLAPLELQNRFRIATTVCNAIFWLSLGVASGMAFQRLVNGSAGALTPSKPRSPR